MTEAAEVADVTTYIGNLESGADALVHVWEELGDLLLLLDRPEEALEAYERSLRTSPGRFNGLLGAARSAAGAGRIDRALALYQQLVDQLVTDATRVGVAESRAFLAERSGE